MNSKFIETVNKCLWLLMAEMELEYNLINFSGFFVTSKIDMRGPSLFSLCELRLYLPLDVQR